MSAVIINDFEVVLEPPPEENGAGSRAEEAQPRSAPVPLDLEDVLERRAIRRARLRAH
jgi:hypothetical protein